MGIESDLQDLADADRAKALARFFKTGKGEYGEGDVFLGLRVGDTRRIAKRHSEMGLTDVRKLLGSRIHERRLAALLILVEKFGKADEKEREKIYEFYLKNTKRVNNWDLVDLSAPNIIGAYLMDKDRETLYKLSRSKSLWERRIAMLATYTFIRKGEYRDALRIAEILLNDKHDLIHKAVGWMLREVGNRDRDAEERFLKKHYRKMPRTMLRYAIEKLPPKRRAWYMRKD